MNRMSEAAVGGSGRRRTSGDAAVTMARAEGVRSAFDLGKRRARSRGREARAAAR